MIRQVETKRRQRDVALLEGPEVAALSMSLEWHDREPVMLAAHRVGAGDDLPVVLVDRLRRPAQPVRVSREVDVDEPRLILLEQERQGPLDPRLEHGEVRRLVVHGCAQRNPADPEQNRLLRGGQSARVPGGIAEVGAQVDPRQDDVDEIPVIRTQRDAVGRRPVHAVGLDVLEDLRPAVAHWPRRCDRMTGRRLFDVGSDDPHVAELPCNPREGRDAGAIDAVVVGHEDAHPVSFLLRVFLGG